MVTEQVEYRHTCKLSVQLTQPISNADSIIAVKCFSQDQSSQTTQAMINSFAPAKIAKKNVRKVAARKTVIINHN